MESSVLHFFEILLGFLGVIGLFCVFVGLIVLAKKKGKPSHVEVNISLMNEKFEKNKQKIIERISTKKDLKKLAKEEKESKKEKKSEEETLLEKRKIFVLDFDGDMSASEVKVLREQISAVLSVATPQDEIVLRLESPGGMVHSYGLAASQLERIRKRDIPLTICVDRVAASGGYMMACLGTKILSAPFSIIGSIGVLAQIPNLHKVLKKNDVEYMEMTAGEYKRTLTLFGEITPEKKEKCQEQLTELHTYFKDHVVHFRDKLDMTQVGTGEYWIGKRALELGLVDEIMTSDEYLEQLMAVSKVYVISSPKKENLKNKLLNSAQAVLTFWQEKSQKRQNLPLAL